MTYDASLQHYGIKGMRWGVRRSQKQLAKASSAPDSEDVVNKKAAAAKVSSTGSTDSLSNKELQDLVTRMNLEQQFSRLSTGQNGSAQKKGESFAKSILKETGKKQVAGVIGLALSPQSAKLGKFFAEAIEKKVSKAGETVKKKKAGKPDYSI